MIREVRWGECMDWNWFYSSVAQSSAALVGVLGAYTFARLVALKSAAREAEARLQDHLAKASALRARAKNMQFDQAAEQRQYHALRQVSNVLLTATPPTDPYTILHDHHDSFSCFVAEEQSAKAIAKAIAACQDHLKRRQAPSEFTGSLPCGDYEMAVNRHRELEAFAAEVEQHVNSLRTIGGSLIDFFQGRTAIWALILECCVLFGAGVVWPLLYLPQPHEGRATGDLASGSKNLMIVVVTVVFMAFLVYLGLSQRAIRLKPMDIAFARKYSRMRNYHPALGAYELMSVRWDQYRSFTMQMAQQSMESAYRLSVHSRGRHLMKRLRILRRRIAREWRGRRAPH